ncbi:LHCP [Ectocarpus sp. CCAP 1310/34]|nr:LHCP [Ectocarpus sp. CCAP 1310/34]
MALIDFNTIKNAYEEPSLITSEGGLREEYSPGDLGFDPAKIKPKNPVLVKKMQNKEISNGRLAMIGIAGMLVPELVNGQDILG